MTRGSGKRLAVTGILSTSAALLFVPLFAFRRLGPMDFWWGFSFSLLLLTGLGYLLERIGTDSAKRGPSLKLPVEIGLGVLSAAALYLVFRAGGSAVSVFLPSLSPGITSIYGFKATASPVRILALMLLVIGPGEEWIWRGVLQRRMQHHWGKWGGWLAATALYAAVHAASGNLLLVLAAGTCGLFWGYLFLRFRSIVLNAVSHALWDVAIFILWPIA